MRSFSSPPSPGADAEQIAAFAAQAQVVRAEPGCLHYDLHAVNGDPDRFVLFEESASAEALREHATSEHMNAADAANKAFGVGPAELLALSTAPVA
ncbi:antibiotic biosynthesis monooxygenase [Nocardia sp. NPDC051463]|uniref:putative quinol monooxygenase n=1 Tax=Nocardia sp. NPDC051463 TaxID=3154845 RepID=UPI0034501AD3